MDGVDAQLARVAAVVLEDRVLRRVIKRHRRLTGIGLHVPHARCYALPRAELEKLVERDELSIDLAELPPRVAILGASRAALAAGDPDELSRAWRKIFHAHVHLALDDLRAREAITAAAIRERIHRIGQTEFDEIRSVLHQEDLLLPPVDDVSTYGEFVALYLELRHFAPRALDRTFPALDLARVDAAIARDLDGAALLAATRPAGAPERPVIDERAPIAREPVAQPAIVDASARRKAARARSKGNRARAAILSLRAGDRDAARADLDALAARLARAVGPDEPGPGWTTALLPVAEVAAAQPVMRFTAEARLLHDLQTACVVAERELKAIDVVGWVLDRVWRAPGSRRPLVRPLPATREVRVARHLQEAVKNIDGCSLPSSVEHERLRAAVRDMVERAGTSVRVAMRPKIVAALDAVALHPRNLPEHVAQKKLVDELLDQAVAVGRLSLGNLRDAISHNDLKLPDLRRHQLRAGDELLRCDAALARSLDGVYRRGEIYLRFLQKASSILFGTPVGRFLTLYLILPLVASFTVFSGLQHMVGWVAVRTVGHEPVIQTNERIYAGAGFLFLMLHVPVFRRSVIFVLRQLARALRLILLDAPLALLHRPLVRRMLGSRFTRWVIQPALPAAIAWLLVDGLPRWPATAGVFAATALALNSRLGRRTQQLVADAVVRWGRQLTGRIVPSAIKYLLELFSDLVELLDRGIYRVDEWLRFKAGQSWLTLIVKGTLGTVWGAIAYFLRLYITLFIEPEVNPIKHFPVVTVAAKIILPFTQPIVSAISGPATRIMGETLGVSFAAFTVIVLPGLAGFLVWELKENWRLYRKTRAKTLREVSFGHHGETMVQLLKPGFHSGTIPKLFGKMRSAAWKDDERAVAKHRAALHHVEEAIHTFVDRELVSMLNEAPAFRVTDVAVAHVANGSNRVLVDLACPTIGPDPARIAFEHQSGWIVASIPVRGWLEQLDDDQRRIFEIALAGFYRRSGVDLIREQLEHVLGDGRPPPPYDVSDEGLVAWPGEDYRTEVIYDLRATNPAPRMRGAPWSGELPTLGGRHALYHREALSWTVWTTVWEQLARGEPPMQIVVGPSLLHRPTAPPALPAAPPAA
jgi:hypothetical protein